MSIKGSVNDISNITCVWNTFCWWCVCQSRSQDGTIYKYRAILSRTELHLITLSIPHSYTAKHTHAVYITIYISKVWCLSPAGLGCQTALHRCRLHPLRPPSRPPSPGNHSNRPSSQWWTHGAWFRWPTALYDHTSDTHVLIVKDWNISVMITLMHKQCSSDT